MRACRMIVSKVGAKKSLEMELIEYNGMVCGGCGLVSIVTSGNEFCRKLMWQDGIIAVDADSYGSIGGHKDSLDQGTAQET